MSNWIVGQQSGILVNLDNLADIVCKPPGKDRDWSVVGYTPSGFGIVIYKGNEKDCERVKDSIMHHVQAQGV